MRRMILRYVRVETVTVLVTAWLAGALWLGLATDAGAVPTAALMALGALLGGLLLLIRHSLDLACRIGNLDAQAARTFETVRRVEADTRKELKQTFRQLEALQNLNAVLPTSDVLPATRGWAAFRQTCSWRWSTWSSPNGRRSSWNAAAARPRCGSPWRCGGSGSTAGSSRSITTRFSAGKTRDFLARHDVLDLRRRYATPRWRASALMARPTRGTPGRRGRTWRGSISSSSTDRPRPPVTRPGIRRCRC